MILETKELLNGQLYNLRNQTEDYTHFWTTGFGKFSNTLDSNSNDLMQVRLPWVKNDLCREIYENDENYSVHKITDNMICAGPQS